MFPPHISASVKNPGQEEPQNHGQKRSKKRRKVMGGNEDVEMADVVQMKENATELPSPRLKSPTPYATLPSFPLPALPDAPPKSVLAIQGLDQALVDAEIVHSTTVFSIPEGEGDAGIGLSKKTRKRLNDLGITELFAGMRPVFFTI